MPTVNVTRKKLSPFECQELNGHCWPSGEVAAGSYQFCRHCSLKRTMKWVEETDGPGETPSRPGRGKRG